jgi:MFS family permease
VSVSTCTGNVDVAANSTRSSVRNRPRWFGGVTAVAAGFVALALCGGLGFYNLSLYVDALTKDHGFSLPAVSGATAAFFVTSGLGGLPAAWLIARVDPRWVLLGGVVMTSSALLVVGQVASIWHLYAAYAALGVGFAGASLVPITAVLLTWFPDRGAGPLAVATTGLSVGGAVFTPVTAAAIDEFGLGRVTAWLALCWLLVGAVAAGLLRSRPAPQVPATPVETYAVAEGATSQEPRQLPDAAHAPPIRVSVFATISAACTLIFLVQVGGITHLIALATEREIASATAVIPVLAVLAVIVRLGCVPLLARVSVTKFTAGVAMFQSAAAIVLALATTRPFLFLGAVLLAVSVGNVIVLLPLLVIEVFGRVGYTRVFASVSLVGQVGLAGGPLLIGVLHEAFNGYFAPFVMMAVASLVAAGLLMTIRRGGPDRPPPGRLHPMRWGLPRPS